MTYVEELREAWADHLAPRARRAPTVISTFAGGGGSSLGYSMAGFRELLAVEFAAVSAAVFALNFPDVPLYRGDIRELTSENAMRMAGVAPGELDVLDGSPPCQGFSMIGRRRFADSRNDLFQEHVRLVRDLAPRVFVVENVPGLAAGKMRLILADIIRMLRGAGPGYRVAVKLMDASRFGVPQIRRRIIFIGIRENLGVEPSHPIGDHRRPVTLREALNGVALLTDRMQSDFDSRAVRMCGETVRGKSHHEWFGFHRTSWSLPARTITIRGREVHPDEPRQLDSAELRRVCSFPDEFSFAVPDDVMSKSARAHIGGNWSEISTTHLIAKYVLGNSVPPLLMRAVARHVRGLIGG